MGNGENMSLVWTQARRVAEMAAGATPKGQDSFIQGILNTTGSGYGIQIPIPSEYKVNTETLATYIRNNAFLCRTAHD